MSQGIVFYEGPSMIDGQPVVAIATGLKAASPNVKTGAMVQVYFIRSDLSPLDAVRTGEDAAICGSCRHRGRLDRDASGAIKNVERSCYVTLFQGPSVVYRSYKAGSYPTVAPEEAAGILKGRDIRLGAYGDPGCIPFSILETIVGQTRSHTGYSHLWREKPQMKSLVMASCDDPSEREEAKALGFRTFRVRSKGEPILKGEGHCPASGEMGKVTTCKDCVLCDGRRHDFKTDISLLVHGVGSGHYTRSRASA